MGRAPEPEDKKCVVIQAAACAQERHAWDNCTAHLKSQSDPPQSCDAQGLQGAQGQRPFDEHIPSTRCKEGYIYAVQQCLTPKAH